MHTIRWIIPKFLSIQHQTGQVETVLGDSHKSITILMADDDADDCLLAREALANTDLPHQLDVVSDGVLLMDYLYRHNRYEALKGMPLPGLILLDLNMPHKGGLDVLREIKSDPHLRRIPVVILTSSETAADVYDSYDMGASSFVTKSVMMTSLVDVVYEIGKYWLEVVELPPELPNRSA